MKNYINKLASQTTGGSRSKITSLKARSYHSGVSMVELMIVMAITLVLVAGTIRFYISNKTVQAIQSEVSQIQTDARFSMEVLSRDLRMANSGSCRTLSYWSLKKTDDTHFHNHVINGPATLNNITPISGWEANNTGPNDQLDNVSFYGAQISGRTAADWTAGGNPVDVNTNLAIPNSDILNIMYSGATNTRVLSGTEQSLTLASVDNIKAGDFLLVSDCTSLDIFVACSVNTANNSVSFDTNSPNSVCGTGNGQVSNDTDAFRSHVIDNSTVGNVSKLVSNTYFVGKPAGGANNSADLIPGLYKISNGSPAQQIIEGVESMQVLYDGKPISSFTNAAMTENIKTVRISLLMSSEDKLAVTDTQRTFNLNGLQVTPTKDQRVRRVYNTTVALRSQL